MAGSAVLEELDFFVGGERRPSAARRPLRQRRPHDRRAVGARRRGVGRRRRRVRAARARGVRVPGVALVAGERARAPALPARRRDPGGRGAHRHRWRRATTASSIGRCSIQLQLVPKWIRYFAGMADKVEGTTIPLDRQSILNYTVPEPLGVVADRHPVELAGVPHHDGRRAGAGRRQHGGRQAVGGHVGVDARGGRARRTSVGFPPGVFNVITGLGDTGKALVEHPLVDKISLTGGVEAGPRRRRRRGPALHAGHARARRQVGEHRVRGRQPRRRRVRGAGRASSPPPVRPASRDRAPSSTSRSTTSWPSG